ncbi:MAG: N-acetylmuramoyl-L-alanine amidase [Hyphomicrobiaceae bacterium]
MTLTADTSLVGALHPSPNTEPRRDGRRPDMLLLHYTGMTSCTAAIDWLSRPESKVSCHYVIDCEGIITQMVAENLRAWHAGVSCWAGETDINSCSIGVEIHNPGHNDGYPDFPEAQMQAVIALAKDCIKRWNIPPHRVLGHSDVAPERKDDPGEKFDWRRLHENGIGHWVEPERITSSGNTSASAGQVSDDEIIRAQYLLSAYGYNIEATAHADDATTKVLTAFQRHFRPERVDGLLDRSTLVTLARLVKTLPDEPFPVA